MESHETVAERIAAKREQLTRAERQLIDVVLADYPVSGLGSISELATKSDVSTPTVARLVQKLGFEKYPEFQAALRAELRDVVSNPIAKRDTWVASAPDEHVLNRFTQEATQNIGQTLEQIDAEEFDAICGKLADEERAVYVTGGRITGTLAQYLFLHLQMIRSGVTLIPPSSNTWPHFILDIKPGDLLVVFDVRRYENSTLTMVEMARERGAETVLLTDQWRSPVQKQADHVIASRIAVSSAWDSSIATMLIIESFIAQVQELRWAEVKDRTEALETAFDRTRLFRKFV